MKDILIQKALTSEDLHVKLSAFQLLANILADTSSDDSDELFDFESLSMEAFHVISQQYPETWYSRLPPQAFWNNTQDQPSLGSTDPDISITFDPQTHQNYLVSLPFEHPFNPSAILLYFLSIVSLHEDISEVLLPNLSLIDMPLLSQHPTHPHVPEDILAIVGRLWNEHREKAVGDAIVNMKGLSRLISAATDSGSLTALQFLTLLLFHSVDKTPVSSLPFPSFFSFI